MNEDNNFIERFTSIFNSTVGQKEVTISRLLMAQATGNLNRLEEENKSFHSRIDELEKENRRLKTSIEMNNDHWYCVEQKNKRYEETFKKVQDEVKALSENEFIDENGYLCGIKNLIEQVIQEQTDEQA